MLAPLQVAVVDHMALLLFSRVGFQTTSNNIDLLLSSCSLGPLWFYFCPVQVQRLFSSLNFRQYF
jgi:hypothetical protein